MDSLEFTVHELPPGLNQLKRMHWAVYKRERDRWLLLVREAVGRNMRYYPGRVAIMYTAYRVQLMDKDNHASSFKLVGDALVKLGILRDDGPCTVDEQRSVYDQYRVSRRADQHITVTIRDLQENVEGVLRCDHCGGVIDQARPYRLSLRSHYAMHTECYARVNNGLREEGYGPLRMILVEPQQQRITAYERSMEASK